MADSKSSNVSILPSRFLERYGGLIEGDILELHRRTILPGRCFHAILMVRNGQKVGDDYLGMFDDKLEGQYEFSIGEISGDQLLCPRTRDLLRFISAMVGFDLEPTNAAGHIPDPAVRQCFKLIAQKR